MDDYLKSVNEVCGSLDAKVLAATVIFCSCFHT